MLTTIDLLEKACKGTGDGVAKSGSLARERRENGERAARGREVET